MRSRKVIAVGTLGLALAALVATLGLRYYLAHRQLSFDRPRWLAASHGYCSKSERGRMVNDLVQNRLRPGMPLRRLRRLLGPPDYRSGGLSGSWDYNVDQEDGLMAICVSLVLHTNAGRLQHAEVYRDY